MEELILEMLEEGDRVIFIFNNSHPMKATFVKCAHHCVVLKSKTGRLVVVRIEDIVRFQKETAVRHQPVERNVPAFVSRQAIVAASEGAEASGDAEEDVKAEESEDAQEAQEQKTDDLPVSLDKAVDTDNVFELDPPEGAKLTVIGKIDLDEIDRKKRKRVTRLQPVSRLDEEDEEESDESDSVFVPAMGQIFNIGPKFGFIQSGGENYYFNAGEIVFGSRNERPLDKGDEVVFTPGHNSRGHVAKAVHHPWSVDRHLRQIERLQRNDIRNASLLARQLVEAFPDDDTVRNELFALGIKGY